LEKKKIKWNIRVTPRTGISINIVSVSEKGKTGTKNKRGRWNTKAKSTYLV
jgi:hypothetical protein